MTDVATGAITMSFSSLAAALPLMQDGRIRAVAVTSRERMPQLPEVPPVAETVPGYEASALFGVGVPNKTPPEIIEKLNKEINAVLAEPAIKARLIDLGGEPLISSPDAFGKMVVAETEKWEKVVKSAGVHVE